MPPACIQNKDAQSKYTMPGRTSILIILMGSLGDLVRGMCLVSQLKTFLPQSEITWLVEPKWAELVFRHKDIDRVVVFDRPGWPAGVVRLYQELSGQKFDLSLDLQRHFKSGFFSLLSRAKRRIGFHRKDAKEFNWIFNTEHIRPYPNDLSKIEHYLKFIEYLFQDSNPELDFGFSDLVSAREDSVLSRQLQEPYTAVILGSSWESKEWPYEHYLQLTKRLLEDTRRRVVLLDVPAKRPMAEKLEAAVRSERIINLVGQTSLIQLAAVLKSAEVAFGPDCGSAHLASAVQTPYVSVFGPTSPERTAPYGNQCNVLQAGVSCAPCYKRRCALREKICMTGIDAGSALDKIEQATFSTRLKN